MKNEKKSIFIHSLFRTGSTYIWNKFRQNDRYYCYYEPFHQNLAIATIDNLENLLTKDYEAVNHPFLNKYYWYEYRKLLKNGCTGLPYFKKSFSFDEFCYNGKNPDLKRYIDSLIIGAGDKIPVLQFNRSALRIKWYKKYYPGSLNIYIARNPRDQWQSYLELHKKTGYDMFFIMDLLIASVNKGNEYFHLLSKGLPLFVYNNKHGEEVDFYQVALNSYSEEEKYLIYYYTWFMSVIENVLSADFILNLNLLSQKPLYREKVINFLIKHGINGIDFEDAKIKEYSSYQLSKKVMNKIEKKAHYLVLHTIPEDQINYFFEKVSTSDRKYFQFNKKDFLALKKKKFRAIDHFKFFDKFEKMILLFSEKFFHIKEQNNILRISSNNKENFLKQKEKIINEKENQLALKDHQLGKKDEQLSQKDEELREKLSDKDKLINEKDKQLALKDHQLSKKDEQLARKDEYLSQKDEELREKLSEKDKLINEKDKQLAFKDHQLSKKDEQLARKDEKLKQKLNEKDKIINEENKQLALKELQLGKKDEQLAHKDKKLREKLSEKDDQLRKKDQELEEKERQLCEKVQKLKLKESYIQKICDSYTYKTCRIILFPFIKIKRLIRKISD